MILAILLFGAGVGLLVGGAWALVDGGKRVAAVLAVPVVVVGLTVVAFGTSAPELFVSLAGAVRGSTGLVLGNVIGSNVANLGLILALGALLRPVAVEAGLVRRELPLLLMVTVAMSALVWDGVLSRPESGLLVAWFVVFLVRTVRGGRRHPSPAVPLPTDLPRPEPGHRLRTLLAGVGLVAAGVAGLAAGGYLIVEAALTIARALGVSETLIGLTLVAVGTSLPELATTVVASLRREDDLAVGNIVGSNLFNVLAVAGPVGLVRPLVDTDGDVRAQVVAMTLVTLLVIVLTVRTGGRLGRGRGAVLLAAYLAVMATWATR